MSINVERMIEAVGCKSKPAIQSLVRMQPQMEAMVSTNLVSMQSWWLHGLAQGAEESTLFSKLVESLYYTTTARLQKVWPSRFRTAASAAPYVKNERKLANFVYNGRMGNRDNSDDGWERRGRGIIMLTGMDNYVAATRDLGIDFVGNPQLASEWDNAWLTYAWFLTTRTYKGANIQSWMAKDNIEAVTYAVNGGQTNITERKKYASRLKSFLATQPGSHTSITKPLLRMNSRGSDVMALQQALWNVGYACGKVDGHFGGNTERAVKELQRAAGLIADGIVGPKTWDAITALL